MEEVFLQSMQDTVNGSDPARGRREAKKRRTRQAIRAAAIELFEARGVVETTIEEIANRADISPRTFFNYFATKEEAVGLPHRLITEVLLRTFAATSPTHRPLDRLRQAFVAVAAALETDTAELEVLITGARLVETHPALKAQELSQQALWEDALQNLLQRDLEVLSARVLATAAVGAARAAMLLWATEGGHDSLVVRTEAAFDVLSP